MANIIYAIYITINEEMKERLKGVHCTKIFSFIYLFILVLHSFTGNLESILEDSGHKTRGIIPVLQKTSILSLF